MRNKKWVRERSSFTLITHKHDKSKRHELPHFLEASVNYVYDILAAVTPLSKELGKRQYFSESGCVIDHTSEPPTTSVRVASTKSPTFRPGVDYLFL